MTLNKSKRNNDPLNVKNEEKDELDEMVEWYVTIHGNKISSSLANKEINNLIELLKDNNEQAKKENIPSEIKEDEAIEWELSIYGGNISNSLADKEIKHLTELLNFENKEDIKQEKVFSKQKSCLTKKRK